jgi:dienelactone hydrolase
MPVLRALVLGVVVASAAMAQGQRSPASIASERVEYASGTLRLGGFVFRPGGQGRHPAIVFLHGANGADQQAVETIGQTFASKGYLLFFPFRRGLGPSAGQGEAVLDRINREVKTQGEQARMPLTIELLTTEQMDDVVAAIRYVRSHQDVDSSRVAIYGHSFGGMLGLFAAERGLGIRAVVASATAAQNWARGPDLQSRLRLAARNAQSPVFFFQAANDFDITPTEALAAEMERAEKTHMRKVYPAHGQSNGDGHMLAVRAPETWAGDVFDFLSAHMGTTSP